jgi:hypothetical protein
MYEQLWQLQPVLLFSYRGLLVLSASLYYFHDFVICLITLSIPQEKEIETAHIGVRKEMI